MRDDRSVFAESDSLSLPKYDKMLLSDPDLGSTCSNDDDSPMRHSSASLVVPLNSELSRMSGEGSPMTMSPWNHTATVSKSLLSREDNLPQNCLIGSLVREEGHIYSLAASSDLLYTVSDSKNIRVWKNLKEFSGFKSNSGLVKAIIVSRGRIFTGHQDGKIRAWNLEGVSQEA